MTRRESAPGSPGRHTRYQGAIVRDDHLLLITHHEHRSGRVYWVLPGGGMEPDESEEECIRREMLEETNLIVSVERLLLDAPAPRKGIYERYRTYLCTVVDGVAAPGCEPEPDVAQRYSITSVGWFDLRNPSSWPPALTSDPITMPGVNAVRAALGYA